jgi:rubrerythrin
MKVDFSTDEIKIFDFDELEAFRIARKLERDGVYFYARMRDEVLTPEIRDVIDMLISDERNHLSLFEEKVADLCREQKVLDEDETLADIVDSHVMDTLKDSEQVANILCDPQEALRLGISTEKRSISFYSNLLQNTRDESGRDALANIISEEEEHLDKLTGLLRK